MRRLKILSEVGLSMVGIIMIIMFGFSMWIWFGTGCYITENKIIISCGPFRSIVYYG